MSVYILPMKQINTLVSTVLYFTEFDNFSFLHNDGQWYRFSINSKNSGNRLGQILVDQNSRSVNHHYQTHQKAPVFHFQNDASFIQGNYKVALQKICACYDYNSCETDDYQSTLAYQVTDRIRYAMIRRLPIYEKQIRQLFVEKE